MAKRNLFSRINGETYDEYLQSQEEKRKDYIGGDSFAYGEEEEKDRFEKEREYEARKEQSAPEDEAAGVETYHSPMANAFLGIFLILFGLMFAGVGGLVIAVFIITGEPLDIFILVAAVFLVSGIIVMGAGFNTFAHRNVPVYITPDGVVSTEYPGEKKEEDSEKKE